MNIFKKGVKAVGKATRAVDLSAKNSAARKSLRKVDKAVGGGQGWGKITQVTGAVVATIPGAQGAGAGIIAAGKGLQMNAAESDAKRAEKKAAAASVAAVATSTADVKAQIATAAAKRASTAAGAVAASAAQKQAGAAAAAAIAKGGPVGAPITAANGVGAVRPPSLIERVAAFLRSLFGG